MNSESLLTKDECLKIIRADPELHLAVDHFHIKSFQLEDRSDLFGFAGEYHRLKINLEITGEGGRISSKQLSYFVKTIRSANTDLYYVHVMRKEMEVYRKILSSIQKYAKWPLYPRCLLSRTDLLVLEDLSAIDDLLMLHFNESFQFTPTHIELFLEHLAEMHVASLEWQLKDQIDVLNVYNQKLPEVILARSNQWYLVGIKAIQSIAREDPKFQYKSALEFIDNCLYDLLENVSDHLSPTRDQCNVFCHRDCWGHNIFYGCDPDSRQPKCCRLIDFQLSRFCSPATDVLFFLYNSVPFSQRKRAHDQRSASPFSPTIEKYLNFYYGKFYNNLKRDTNLMKGAMSLEDFYRDCRRSLLPTLAAKGACEPLIKLPKTWPNKVQVEEPENYNHYMNVDRSEMFRRVVLIDNKYLDTIRQPVEEIMEYFGYKPQTLKQ